MFSASARCIPKNRSIPTIMTRLLRPEYPLTFAAHTLTRAEAKPYGIT